MWSLDVVCLNFVFANVIQSFIGDCTEHSRRRPLQLQYVLGRTSPHFNVPFCLVRHQHLQASLVCLSSSSSYQPPGSHLGLQCQGTHPRGTAPHPQAGAAAGCPNCISFGLTPRSGVLVPWGHRPRCSINLRTACIIHLQPTLCVLKCAPLPAHPCSQTCAGQWYIAVPPASDWLCQERCTVKSVVDTAASCYSYCWVCASHLEDGVVAAQEGGEVGGVVQPGVLLLQAVHALLHLPAGLLHLEAPPMQLVTHLQHAVHAFQLVAAGPGT